MKQTLPSDKLARPARPGRAIAIIGAIVVLGVAAYLGGQALLTPDNGRDGASIVHLTGEAGKPTTPQLTHKLMLTQHVLKSTTPPPPPPPPEPEPVYNGGGGGSGGGGGNSGAAVPFYPSSDPNNAAGGDYADPGSFCTSGSASGFPPICD